MVLTKWEGESLVWYVVGPGKRVCNMIRPVEGSVYFSSPYTPCRWTECSVATAGAWLRDGYYIATQDERLATILMVNQ